MPNAPKTQHRSIRVDDAAWCAAKAAAAANGETVTDVVRRALAAYVATTARAGARRAR